VKSLGLLVVLAPLALATACSKPDSMPMQPASTGLPIPSSPVAIASSPASASAAVPVAAAAPSSEVASADPLLGKPAPDFTAKTQDGKTVHLAALKGKKVVVYFYPKDETPGCTAEACSFRDSFAQIEKTGAVLIGISMDNLDSHKAFTDHFKLPFSLISDADGAIAKAYAVPTTGGYTARQTFVIGKDGNVAKVYRKVSVPAHAAEILADVGS
jgi:peroxiredoxin Q/BCP